MSRTSPTLPIVTLALVLGSLLAMGTVHAPALYAVSVVAALSPVLIRGSHLGDWQRRKLPRTYAILLALAVYSCLQALPLPLAWVASLSPQAADVWRRSLLPMGEVPKWGSLSLDPGASLIEALKWLTYANVFLLAQSLARMRGAIIGASIVFGSAVLCALITLAHGLVGATSVYGSYQPIVPTAPLHLGPLLNPNNLAGYLNLGTFSGLGLLLKRQDEAPVPRWLLAVGIASTIGVSVTTASRAGLISLVFGLFVFALFAIRRRRSWARALGVGALALSVLGGLILALLGATHTTWQALFSKDLAKLKMVLWAKPMLADYPFVGIGRGAFESVFPAYRPPGGNVVFTHIESFPAQWIVEWGAPVGLSAIVAFAWALAPRRTGHPRGSLVIGMGIGLGVLLLQNLADLALEVPAVSIAAVTLLGTLFGRAERARKHESSVLPASRFTKRGWQAVTCLLPLALVAFLLGSGWHDITSDLERVRRRIETKRPEDLAAAQEATVASMRRHPADPYFPLMGGVIARRELRSPMPWLSASLERAVVNPRAHLVVGDVLHSLGRTEQALLELRIALEQEPTLSAPVAVMAIGMSRDFEKLVSVAQAGEAGAWVLEDMALRLADPADSELRLLLYREAMRRDEARPGPRLALGEALVSALENSKAGPCQDDPAACVAEIEAHAEAVEAALPDSSGSARLRAGTLVARGRAEDGEKLLSETCPRVSDELRCLRARVVAAARAEKTDLLPAALKALLARACTTTRECADAASFAGHISGARGDRGAALGHYLRAAREDSTEARWREVARAAVLAGAHSQAADALERIARIRGGEDRELRQQIDEARLKALSR